MLFRSGDDGAARTADTPAGVRAMCFAKTARCDLQAAGRKIVGSAQVRRERTILQHGSIPITIDLQTQAAVMPGEERELDASRVLSGAAMSVSELIGRPLGFEELSEAVIAGFAEALHLDLVEDELSSEERAAADRLGAEKYASEEFTRRI